MSLSLIDLPTEVMAHIFSFVSHKKDRRNLALLCKRFYNIVRQQSKKHNHLDLTDKKKKIPLFRFENRDELPFQNITLDVNHIVARYNSFWQRHGAEITQITLNCRGLDEFRTFGSKLKELFPNLKSLSQQSDFNPRSLTESMTLGDAEILFSEKITDLHFNLSRDDSRDLKKLDSTLELFPGLKYLKLAMFIFTYSQNSSKKQEIQNFLDKWLLRLENITLNVMPDIYAPLFGAFEGWSNEKLSFEYFKMLLIPYTIEFIKSFFSVPRHIKTFEIVRVHDILDSNLCALINQNATIDRLTIPGNDLPLECVMTAIPEYKFSKLEGLINASGVKEIYVGPGVEYISSINEIQFTSEALLKVKQIGVYIKKEEDLLRISLFRNLRQLSIHGCTLGIEEIEFIANHFPFLEHLNISRLQATSGHTLANMQHLQSLEICDSPRLSDTFFDFGSQLLKMKSLSVLNVPNLSLAGVKSIVANCPQIESIKFEKCNQITEECIDVVAQKLFYIERIEVIWTNPSLKSVHHQRLSLKRKYSEFVH